MKKAIVIFLLLLIGIGGYFYYDLEYAPNRFLNSFLNELEYNGANRISSKYFIRELFAEPSVNWEEFYLQESESKLPKETLFDIWKSSYLRNIIDYVDVSIDYPNPTLMTYEQFRSAYNNFDMSDIEIGYKERKDRNFIRASGYVHLRYTGGGIGQRISGTTQWNIIIRKGSEGWKVIAFSVKL